MNTTLSPMLAAALLASWLLPATADLKKDREAGQAVFAAHCSRCHGERGGDTTLYPGIKSLVDITQRMTPREVIDKSRGFVSVALNPTESATLFAFLDTLRVGNFATPELLLETSWVAVNGTATGVRIVDLRRPEAYRAGHIPGAVQMDEAYFRDASDKETYQPSPSRITELLSAAGVAPSDHLVLYDDQGGRSATRMWYALQIVGHARISVVNGGWNKWKAEGRAVQTEVPPVVATSYKPATSVVPACPSSEVLARKPGVVFLDVRTAAEYGRGRIPGAVNVDWTQSLIGPHQTFRPAAELKKLFADAGLTPDREIVTYCATGGRASHTLFTLKLLGYPKVRMYYGSFTDYAARNAPLEK